jgi:hypothetical protein
LRSFALKIEKPIFKNDYLTKPEKSIIVYIDPEKNRIRHLLRYLKTTFRSKLIYVDFLKKQPHFQRHYPLSAATRVYNESQ